jgi:hypothetical protein
MAGGEQRHQHLVDGVALADDGLADLFAQRSESFLLLFRS